MIKNIFSYILIISLLVIIYPSISFGQDITNSNFIEITINPENPEPQQTVKLGLKSFTYDLNRSKISWFVNDQQKVTEMGLTNFSVQAGKNGQKTTVKAVIETPSNDIKEIEVFFIPSIVDLIYESLSYTPPFYKGRALNPNQGIVLIVAVPELIRSTGEKIPTQNIIYSWKKNGKVEQASSGIGKNIFIFQGTIPIRDSLIEVTASSIEGDIYASKKVNITNDDTKIIFYEDSPVYGIMFNRAISKTVRMLTDEFKVKAFPYFMSVGYAQSPDLNYKWTINSKISENLDIDKSAMIFRQEGEGPGLANINLKIENISRIFQFTDNNFVINFEK
jgi:hypothetical protein